MLNIERYKDEILKEYDCNDVLKCFLEWLCAECKEPLLTAKERDYLKAVLKPFWQDIEYVKKYIDSDGEYLRIKSKKGILADVAIHPHYWRGCTFFKGMEVEKKYTLEELGITYDTD